MGQSRPDEFHAEEPSGLLERPAHERTDLARLALECGAHLLGEGATRIVPGEGNPHARVVLVGEAPGEEEDRQGRPFVGRSGKLLDRLLSEAGLERGELWITNTVKARPVAFEDGRKRNRAPKASEVKAWSQCLHDELRRIRPQLLVGLGAVAGQALVGRDFKITRQRGEWLQDRILAIPALVTWHPSYLLRQKGEAYDRMLAEARADFAAVRERLQRGG